MGVRKWWCKQLSVDVRVGQKRGCVLKCPCINPRVDLKLGKRARGQVDAWFDDKQSKHEEFTRVRARTHVRTHLWHAVSTCPRSSAAIW
jgi:hypothetical protein